MPDRTLRWGLALAVFAALACQETSPVDGTEDDGSDGDADSDADTDSDVDADAGSECLSECEVCDAEGAPCCGEMYCEPSTLDPPHNHCQPPYFTDSDLCADPETGTDGSCAPLGLECIYWHETDSGGEEQLCACDGWDYSVID